jgi:hypothetical protein
MEACWNHCLTHLFIYGYGKCFRCFRVNAKRRYVNFYEEAIKENLWNHSIFREESAPETYSPER